MNNALENCSLFPKKNLLTPDFEGKTFFDDDLPPSSFFLGQRNLFFDNRPRETPFLGCIISVVKKFGRKHAPVKNEVKRCG